MCIAEGNRALHRFTSDSEMPSASFFGRKERNEPQSALRNGILKIICLKTNFASIIPLLIYEVNNKLLASLRPPLACFV